jgi:hypothetical protein
MQGINSREHRILAAAFDKFELMSAKAINKLEESEYNDTKNAVKELDALYERFQTLYGEIEKCIKDYESKKKAVRAKVNRSNRKLIAELNKNEK